MDDFENQVTEQETAGQESVVDSQQEDVTEQEQDTGEGGKSEPAPQKQIHSQSHQDNAAAKAARIRAEQMTRDLLRQQYDEQIAKMNIPNPYTGKPIKNFKEFQEYGERFNAERLSRRHKKGDNCRGSARGKENKEWVSKKRKEDKEIEERKRFLLADVKNFIEKFPDVEPKKA